MRWLFLIFLFMFFLPILSAAPPISSNGVMYSCDKEEIAKEFLDVTGDGQVTDLDFTCLTEIIMEFPLSPFCQSNTGGTGNLHFYDMNGSCEEPGHTALCITNFDRVTLTKYLSSDPILHAEGLAEMGHVQRVYARRLCDNPPTQPCSPDSIAEEVLDLHDDGVINALDGVCITNYLVTGGYPETLNPNCVPADKVPENYSIAYMRGNQAVTSTSHLNTLQAYINGVITAEELPDVSQVAAIHNCNGGGSTIPPVFTGESVEARYQFFTNRGTGTFPVYADDPDGDDSLITFSVSGNPPGSSLGPAVDGYSLFNWNPLDGQIGDFDVTITATDESGTSTNMVVTLHSAKFERIHFTAPPGPILPITQMGNSIFPPAGHELVVGTTFEMDINMSPSLYGGTNWEVVFENPINLPDGTPVAPTLTRNSSSSFRFAWNPDLVFPSPGINMDIEFYFVGNPALKYYPAHRTGSPAGSFPLTYNFRVGGGLNSPPVMSQPLGIPNTFQVFPGENFELEIVADDPDGPPIVNYSAVSNSTPAIPFNWNDSSSPPVFSFTPTPAQVGESHEFTFTAQDNIGQEVQVTTAINIASFDLKLLASPGDNGSDVVVDPDADPILLSQTFDPSVGGVTVELDAPLRSPNDQNENWVYSFVSINPALPPGIPSPIVVPSTGEVTFSSATPYGNFDVTFEASDGFSIIQKTIRFSFKQTFEFAFTPAPDGGGTPADTYFLAVDNFLMNVGYSGGILPVSVSLNSTNIPPAHYSWDGGTGSFGINDIGILGGGPYQAEFQLTDSESPTNETIVQIIHFFIGSPPLEFTFFPAPLYGGSPLDTYYIQSNLEISVGSSGGIGGRNLNLISTSLPGTNYIWTDNGDNGSLEILFAGIGSGPFTAEFELTDNDSPINTESFTLNFIVGAPPGFAINLNPEPSGIPNEHTYYVQIGDTIDIELSHVDGIDPVAFDITSIDIPVLNYRLTNQVASPPTANDLFQFSSVGLDPTIYVSEPYQVTFRAIDSDDPAQEVPRTIFIHVGLPGYAAWYDTRMVYLPFDQVSKMNEDFPDVHGEGIIWEESVKIVETSDFSSGTNNKTNDRTLCESNLSNQIDMPREEWNLKNVSYQRDIYGSMLGQGSFSRECHQYLKKLQKYHETYSGI
ncbi:hypothetical protein N9N67_01085 [Bacteriovoracaceae bacterium]|nr:hypothetical protein [Bacteriovoracaceae bacterium]